MTKKPIDPERRKVLGTTAALVGGIGIGATGVPFVQSMLPSARAKALGADVEVDIGSLEPGELMVVEWRGFPVWILRRTSDMLKDIEALEDRLKDPDSDRESQQPEYARNRGLCCRGCGSGRRTSQPGGSAGGGLAQRGCAAISRFDRSAARGA